MENWCRISARISAGILSSYADGVEFDPLDIDGIVMSQIPEDEAENAGKIRIICMATLGPYFQPVVRQTILAQAELAGLLTP